VTAETGAPRPEAPAPASAAATDGSTAARGAVFIGFAKLYFMLSGFVQQVLLTRFVGAAEFGAFAVVNNVISIVNNTVVQATIQSVSKYTAEDDARAGAVQRAGLRMQVVLGAALALAIFLGAPLIARFEEAPRYTSYFRIAAAIPFLYALYAVFVGSANGLRRFRTQASFDVGFSTAKTILLLGLAVLWKVTGAFVGEIRHRRLARRARRRVDPHRAQQVGPAAGAVAQERDLVGVLGDVDGGAFPGCHGGREDAPEQVGANGVGGVRRRDVGQVAWPAGHSVLPLAGGVGQRVAGRGLA
jgi:Polysaccharide biosynthesis protein